LGDTITAVRVRMRGAARFSLVVAMDPS